MRSSSMGAFGSILDPQQTIQRLEEFIEGLKVSCRGNPLPELPIDRQLPKISWVAPEPGWLKFNVDGVALPHGLAAEAIWQALRIILHFGWSRVIIESDSKESIDYLLGSGSMLHREVENLLEDIKRLSRDCAYLVFWYIPRLANNEAYLEAEQALSESIHFSNCLFRFSSPIDLQGDLDDSYSIMSPKALDYEALNENVKKVAYAVRGELYLRASELQKEGKKIIFTNVGNPHALGQKPLTFPRQVVALCQAPFLLDDPNVGLVFPADAIARAKHYLSMTSGGLGAYSDSRGLPGIRKEVAEFIERRDGDPELIFLTDGASKGVMQILNTIIRGELDGILVPVPQYPLYSAAISLFGGSLVPYYLEETANWDLDINNIRQSVAQARSRGISVSITNFISFVLEIDQVRAMVIINPGNPTGQCLSEASLKELLRFCWRENLVLLADEVYQQNIYQDERPFISARKVLMDMGHPISKDVQLVSFHTVSKGYWGECGQRGGYFEMTNIPPQTVDEIYKVASISLSPNVPGQIFLGLMVNPPKPVDISYLKFVTESKGVLESLRRRAQIMTDGFNSCRNVVCNFTEGAMYSFPQIRLPPKAIEAAKTAGKIPDVFYCLKLLEATGISTVPGSGFGQKEGVYHLRTTILPAEEDMPAIMASFKKFNDAFMKQYEDQRGYSRM
ncbi:hypothetical protein HHK36_029581 [Tetracentron sinense]|uniref:Alanine transaminase n=1 Tax=Tetracentron sinense TaxID=13715 RepID=A0A834YDX4_TETSI|nr:hypothetical protein HHK36_029581 [Tetracentron sinense]